MKENKTEYGEFHYTSEEEKNKIFDEIDELEKREKNSDYIKSLEVRFKNEHEIENFASTEDISEIKNLLKIELFRKGYQSIEDYAKKSKLNYSIATIKMSFSPKHKTSEKILGEIAAELGCNLIIKKRFLLQI